MHGLIRIRCLSLQCRPRFEELGSLLWSSCMSSPIRRACTSPDFDLEYPSHRSCQHRIHCWRHRRRFLPWWTFGRLAGPSFWHAFGLIPHDHCDLPPGILSTWEHWMFHCWTCHHRYWAGCCFECVFSLAAESYILTRVAAGPIYIGELAPAEIRGKIMSFWQMFYSVGSFIAYVISPRSKMTSTKYQQVLDQLCLPEECC